MCPAAYLRKPAQPVNDAERKRISTLAARLAIASYELHELVSGEFLIAKWGLQKFCKSLNEAEEFARRVGALK